MDELGFESFQRAHPVFARFLASSDSPDSSSSTASSSSTPCLTSEEDNELQGIGFSNGVGDGVADLEKPISAHNKGFQLLCKMGWNREQGLGKHQQGRLEPIPLRQHLGTVGVGQREEYDATSALATEQRKLLETEREETEELKQQREAAAMREQELEATREAMHRQFYCSLCNKQYTRVHEYESHLDSYDHNHKKRFEATKRAARVQSTAELSKKKRREQQREQKAMEAMLAAAAAARSGSVAGATSGDTASPAALNSTATPTDTSIVSKPSQTGLATIAKPITFGFKAKKKAKRKPLMKIKLS